MADFEETYYPDVPPEFEAVQRTLDSFAEINYNSALDAAGLFPGDRPDAAHYKGQIRDIVRNNPPLGTVPEYFRDGRADYLWYSDFYDAITKDALRKYRTFTAPTDKITPATYTEELGKIDLPYFPELVSLIGLERMYARFKVSEPSEEYIAEELTGITEITPDPAPVENIPQPIKPLKPLEPLEPVEPAEPAEAEKPKPTRLPTNKRSYEPRMNDKQYSLLAQCMETIRLFRRPVSVAKLKKLFKGRLSEPVQVTNQKSLVYLFDLLKEQKFIKETWISVADGNGDFISFLRGKNQARYSSEFHVIDSQSLSNNRVRYKREYINGLDTIDETVESMVEYGDK